MNGASSLHRASICTCYPSSASSSYSSESGSTKTNLSCLPRSSLCFLQVFQAEGAVGLNLNWRGPYLILESASFLQLPDYGSFRKLRRLFASAGQILTYSLVVSQNILSDCLGFSKLPEGSSQQSSPQSGEETCKSDWLEFYRLLSQARIGPPLFFIKLFPFPQFSSQSLKCH